MLRMESHGAFVYDVEKSLGLVMENFCKRFIIVSFLGKTNILVSHFSSSKQSISVPNLKMMKRSFGIMLSAYLCTPTSPHQSEDMQM